MNRALDVLFINADSSAAAYQELAKDYSAIEPPTWALLLAQSCRSKGFGVGILDCGAERLDDSDAVSQIMHASPRLACFVVYGQNPNSGTTNMVGATALAARLKDHSPGIKICFVGSHTSALPKDVLAHDCVDVVLLNEGVYALHNLLRSDLGDDLSKIKGIGYKRDGHAILNEPEQVVSQARMDEDLPGYAWDLLPYRSKPLDLYRSHFWHAEFNHDYRSPFTAIYTSLGCRFKCDFCMINIVNRNNNEDGVSSANSPMMRYWSSKLMLGEFDKLASMGVETLRISDEMFFLDKHHFEPLLDGIIERGHKFRMWTYSRVDTVREQYLEKFRKAGIGWFGLGIEAGNQMVRREASKGSFKDMNIRDVCKLVRANGINIIANYIVGFPEDTMETMNQTKDLALELNTEMMNVYTCMALPGSPLYQTAKQKGWRLPDSYAGYAFLSYDTLPLPTNHLSPAEVLGFRDSMWREYFTHEPYLQLVESKFGLPQRRNVEDMAKITLKRRILEKGALT